MAVVLKLPERPVLLEEKVCHYAHQVCEHFEEVEIIEHHAHRVLAMSTFGTWAAILGTLVALGSCAMTAGCA